MSIKISELAKKLSIDVKALRKKVQDMHLGISERANVFRDDLAEEIIRRMDQTNSGKENIINSEVLTNVADSGKTGDGGLTLEKILDQKEAVIEKNDALISSESFKQETAEEKILENDLKTIVIPQLVSVGEFAAKMGLGVSEVIKELMKNGILANINEHIDYETAAIIGSDLGFEIVLDEQKDVQNTESSLASLDRYDENNLLPRPPIVTVMGHVDHGKTSILDKIRQADVVLSESGGITQHIGAYQVRKNNRSITFLDTPGHQAFSAMRAHGAKLTDVAVLVVAADDGVKPQTVEAINHARAASVPIVVAINKMDKPGANIERVKRELSDYNLVPEEWGGKTIMVATSAKTGEGIDQLLEMILLVADLEDLKAYRDGPAQGVVIEAHLNKGVGPVATLMITQGCLKVRDSVVVGLTDGTVRAMVDFTGERITKAFPSDPVRLAGLTDVPEFGDNLYVVGGIKQAKQIVLDRKKNMSYKGFSPKVVGMAELSEAVREGQIKELAIILKADVQGSLEAIKSSLDNTKNDEVKVTIMHSAVGAVNESDVLMAASARALILSFRVKTEPNAIKVAKKMGVKVSNYDVIYRLLDDVKSALEGLLKPEIVNVRTGRGKVLRIFTHGKKFRVLGVSITKGEAQKGQKAIVFRDDAKIGEGIVENLKRGTDSVDKVDENHECGIGLTGTVKVEEGDKLEFWKTETRLRKLE